MVEKDTVETAGNGRIFVPETSQRTTCTGRVLATGPECPDDLKPGDMVYWLPYDGYTVTVQKKYDREFFTIKARAIIGTLHEKGGKKK